MCINKTDFPWLCFYCADLLVIVKKLDDDVSHRIIKNLDKFEVGRDVAMWKAEDLLLHSKTTIVGAAKRELYTRFRPLSLVIGAVIMIDSHQSGQWLEEKMSNMDGVVTELSNNVKVALDGHSNLGDEVAKLVMEVSKLSTLISKEPPNAEVEKKMDAILVVINKLVSEYAKKNEQKKTYGLGKIMHDIVTWLFDD